MKLRQHATLALMAVTGLVSIGIWVTGNLQNAATAMGFIAARIGGLSRINDGYSRKVI